MERWMLKILHGTTDANKEVVLLRVQKKSKFGMTWGYNDMTK